jgi:hypothetical protein
MPIECSVYFFVGIEISNKQMGNGSERNKANSLQGITVQSTAHHKLSKNRQVNESGYANRDRGTVLKAVYTESQTTNPHTLCM